MKKYGEIISSDKDGYGYTVRVYKIKNEEGKPTSLTVNVSSPLTCQIGNFVGLEMNMPLFVLSTLLGYMLPFLAALLSYLITGIFTDSLIITQSVFLISLTLCYISGVKISRLDFFKKFTVCTITEIIEE